MKSFKYSDNGGKKWKNHGNGRNEEIIENVDIPDQLPANEPDLTLQAWFSPELAYLGMLFILALTCTMCSAAHFKDKWHACIRQLC